MDVLRKSIGFAHVLDLTFRKFGKCNMAMLHEVIHLCRCDREAVGIVGRREMEAAHIGEEAVGQGPLPPV